MEIDTSRCSHGPVGRLPNVKSNAWANRPQAGGYKHLLYRSSYLVGERNGCVCPIMSKVALEIFGQS